VFGDHARGREEDSKEWYVASSREPSEWYPTRLVSLSFATAQISELVGLVAIGLVGQPVGFGLVWSWFVIGLVWFGLYSLVLLVWFNHNGKPSGSQPIE
jgi:hypothetical protein